MASPNTAAALPTVPLKPYSYYMARLNLRDGGKSTKRMADNAIKDYGERFKHEWETMKKAMGLHNGTPEQRRIGYSMRLNATIPFAIMDPATGQPQMQPAIDPNTGQVPLDEKGQPVMQPVIEQRPKWAVLRETFPKDYRKQAVDAFRVGATLPPEVVYDAQQFIKEAR